MGSDVISHKYDVIKAHCVDVGRDYGDIEKTVLSRFALSRAAGTSPSGDPLSSVDEVVERIGRLGELGTDTVIASMSNNTDEAAYELVAEVVRQIEPIVPAGR